MTIKSFRLDVCTRGQHQRPGRGRCSKPSADDPRVRCVCDLGGTSAWPLRRVIGKPAVFALALNAALTLGVMLTPSGRSLDTDILHAFFAVLAYFSLALVGQLGAVALRRRGFMLPPSPRNGGRGSVIGHAEETGLWPSCRCRHSRRRCSHSRSCVRSLRGPDR